MKILILGGTRYLGKRLAEMLLDDDHEVTVLSRHPEKAPSGAIVVGSQRDAGIKKLSGVPFDMVVDFIAFDGQSSADAMDELSFKIYILISSTWMGRLGKNLKADQRIGLEDITEKKHLPIVTQQYLLGKLEAEGKVLDRYQKKKDAVILRLPILWGTHDPTGRIEFYLRRILDGYPIIRVNGGNNIPSMAWTEDISQAISLLIAKRAFGESPIWEGLTADQLTTKDIIATLAEGLGRELSTVDISTEDLQKAIPQYLEAEPLWMLEKQWPTGSNIFWHGGLQETRQSNWLKRVSRETVINRNLNDEKLRAKEIRVLRNL